MKIFTECRFQVSSFSKKFDNFFANSTKSFCIYNNKGHSRIRNNLTVFISKQVVIFTFTVVPITVTDSSYTFTILATYDTQVPIPVITITPLLIDVPQIDSRGATTITFTTITNHGLVAGQKAGVSFGSEFRLKLLVNPIGQWILLLWLLVSFIELQIHNTNQRHYHHLLQQLHQLLYQLYRQLHQLINHQFLQHRQLHHHQLVL